MVKQFEILKNIEVFKMSLEVLNQQEINEVSGAGTFIGDSIIKSVNLFNKTLNTPLISSVGVTFSKIGFGLQYIHQAADTTGYVASKVGIAAGRILGGDVAESQNHYDKEKSEGLYPVNNA